MLVVPEQQYPLVCMAVSKGAEQGQVVNFHTLNPNSTSSWFTMVGRCQRSLWEERRTQGLMSVHEES